MHRIINVTKTLFIKLFKFFFKNAVLDIVNNEIRVWGPSDRLKISSKAKMVNTLFNTNSGSISVDDYTFTGHNVSIITGTHDYNKFNEERINFPLEGKDVIIGKGVWIGSNSIILGPCKIGDYAVISAGSVVITDVEPCTVVAGVPAKTIRKIDRNI
jgi:acetyltransferase-like isoleucine patch superfamily enzyme